MHNSIIFVCSPDTMGAVSFINTYLQLGQLDTNWIKRHTRPCEYSITEDWRSCVISCLASYHFTYSFELTFSLRSITHITVATKKDDIQVNMKSNCTFLIHFTGVHDSLVYIIPKENVYLLNLLSKCNNFPF